MKVQRVVTNETCNQNCWFCNARRPVERREFVDPSAVRLRIAEARAGNPEEIVLTGGEPTLRADLHELVREAANGGAAVVLETNATLIDRQRALQLAAAGLRRARVQLVAWGDAADAITHEVGGFAAARDGIEALAAAGVAIEITTPVVRRNLEHLPTLVREIAAARLPVQALVLVIPTTAPASDECAALDEIASAVNAVSDTGRRVGLSVRLDPATYVPPCIFPKPERVAHLFALNRGNAERRGFARVEECQSCLVNDRCPGMPVAMVEVTEAPKQSFGARDSRPKTRPIEIHPIVDDRVRRRMTVVSSVAEQIEREIITRDQARIGDELVSEHTIRVNFHCNQACEFCFVSTHLPPPQEQAVQALIVAAGSEKATVVLSGGEPTLNPRLAQYVRLAKQSGAPVVELQTNAIRLADPTLTRTLVEAGLDRAMVSLHGSTAEISDRITGAPGTFASTLRGIDELTRTALDVRVNFVFCEANRNDFANLVGLVEQRWPTAGITISFVGSHTDVVPRSVNLIPRFTDVVQPLMDGLARATAAGIQVRGFDSMCGLPLCLVPASARADLSTRAPQSSDGGGEFVKGEVCSQCSESRRCYGVRRGYAELYGTAELTPL